MTTFDFDKALAEGRTGEINERVAVALGWTDISHKYGASWGRMPGDGKDKDSTTLPNWIGSDGLAFEELLPHFKDYDWSLSYRDTQSIYGHAYLLDFCKSGENHALYSNLASHVICKAFLELKEGR